MLNKIQDLVKQAGQNTEWVIPKESEVLELDNENSDGTFIGTVTLTVLVSALLKKYLHFDLHSVACFFCTISFVSTKLFG